MRLFRKRHAEPPPEPVKLTIPPQPVFLVTTIENGHIKLRGTLYDGCIMGRPEPPDVRPWVAIPLQQVRLIEELPTPTEGGSA